MSPQHDTFNNAIDHFSAEEEEIRTAAAFAAGVLTIANSTVLCVFLSVYTSGNIAIGNLHQFLPAILKVTENDPAKRLLSLHALKEVSFKPPSLITTSPNYSQVVTHCSHGQLENVAEMLWVPLFQNSEESEEITRNVAAACLGKLAITAPSRYLPQLHVRLGYFYYMQKNNGKCRNVFATRILLQGPPSSLPFVTLSPSRLQAMTNL